MTMAPGISFGIFLNNRVRTVEVRISLAPTPSLLPL